MQRTASFLCAMIATLMCMLSTRSPHGSSLLPLLLCPVAAQQHAPFAVDTSSNRLAFLEQNLADNEDNDDDDHNHNRTARAMTLIAGQANRAQRRRARIALTRCETWLRELTLLCAVLVQTTRGKSM